ncbi:Protein of unknown function (DUF3074) [Teratosphaeria destructans]|uniref:DUF3074 domain-containing protein n=1 Tax=Teratosphaeria destructans TaxID=418781 RepID=A0A9W7SVA9_9PEZI|nr:Protein of unknown function (DUF3074) [Teratosphaeria destructans]
MADIHEALKWLSPTSWSDVPIDDLSDYLSDSFNAGELLCNSVPPPPDGESFHSSRPHHKKPNQAKSSKEMHPSTARPNAPHESHAELQHHWGKPMKFKESNNPHHVALYKMAGKDRHGAWFARRSVHEGMGFTKFRRAMQREFAHSLTQTGPPGTGAVRGLAADRRLEEKTVEGVGKMEVYQLSAQMPKPVTPRHFWELLMTSDNALGVKSESEALEGNKHVPRHYMIISRPIEHPDTQNSSFVRGQYESVEMIREIPLHQAAQKGGEGQDGRSRAATAGSAKSGASEATAGHEVTNGETDEHAELNPVEWIMITRSDPGGGIPRFMVERGTPDAMLGDVAKFLDWATAFDEVPDADEDAEAQQNISKGAPSGHDGPESATATSASELQANGSGSQATTPPQRAQTEPAASQQQQGEDGGILTNAAHAIGTGLAAYAPASVAEQVQHYLHPDDERALHDNDSDDSSDTSSADSFMSAEEMRRMSTAPEAQSTDTLSVASNTSELAAAKGIDKKDLSQHDKEVMKLMQKREKLDRKLAKKREEEYEKMKKAQAKDDTEQEKTKSKVEKEMQKAEEKHKKEIEKLEHKKEREMRKAEQKRKKKDDAHRLSMVSRERDEYRSNLETSKKENKLLIDRVEELQRENTILAQRLGKVGGATALEGLSEEAEGLRKRTASMKSEVSGKKSLERGGERPGSARSQVVLSA